MKQKKHELRMKESLKIIQTAELNEQAKKQVLDLWNNEYPEKLSYNNLTDFDNYFQNLSNLTHFLLTSDENLIFGWALTFDRENEKWFAIILSEKIKGQGLGRKMLEKIKQTETILNGWVIDHNNDKKKNGQLYASPMKFYEKCGFEIHKERLELDKISAVKIKWTDKKQ
ncbi:GNAT family N-acetyltransferase [Flavobacterium sp. LHD-80]|uniref:GNAT family N-acetyltransferase n=1 Tax=Flavobacterium sp. LHD-80 TaxID=3071411 RepID=UPI0027DF32AE|nr:GNAT family N-acetyltransferase [Flavobacterium sp. LHD-80]MDQ6469906.1 GNAT family N-acetyltransferase [Flavobacterium sp. LHD-80]